MLRDSSPRFLALGVVLVLSLAMSGVASSATSGTVVGASVPTATSLSTTGCAPNDPARTSFGAVLPGSSAVTSADCSVVFGASNSTAMLRMRQTDRGGTAMRSRPTGELDTTYGTAGEVLGAPLAHPDDEASGVMVDTGPDGSTYLVASIRDHSTYEYTIRVQRFEPDGSPDLSYGTAGTATRTGPTTGYFWAPQNAAFTRIVVLDDGALRIVVDEFVPEYRVAVYGFDKDGAPDAAFGTAGRVVVTDEASSSQFLVATPDDGLIVGFTHGDGINPSTTLSTRRIDALTGAVDTARWGSPPATTFDLSGDCANNVFVTAVEHVSEGRVLWSLTCDEIDSGPGPRDVLIGLTDATGRPSQAYPTNGYAVLPRWGVDEAVLMSLLLSGDTVYAPRLRQDGGADAEIIRFDLETGTLDATWGTGGRVSHGTLGKDNAAIFHVVHDGTGLLASGVIQDGIDFPSVLYRLRSDGSLDPAFGTGGVVELALDPGTMRMTHFLRPLAGGSFLLTFAYLDTTGNEWVPGAARFAAHSFPDFSGAWGPPGGFGTCLHALTGASASAPAPWSVAGSGNCTMANDGAWRAIPGTSSTIATTGTTGLATAALRFGLRSPTAQPSGNYEAPIHFEVIAP